MNVDNFDDYPLGFIEVGCSAEVLMLSSIDIKTTSSWDLAGMEQVV